MSTMSALSSATHNTRHYHVRVAILRPICKQRASPLQLLCPGFGRFGEHSARATTQRVGITTAMSLHGNCCLGGLAVFVRSQFSEGQRRSGGTQRRPTA